MHYGSPRARFSITALGGVSLAGAILWSGAGLAVRLPVPCAAGTCSPGNTSGFTTAPSGFVTYGQASATQSGNQLTVSQTSNQAILNWASFNIDAGGKVVFQQPSATAVALNKIYDANPSSIFGELSANGQIYLINPNGFVFGAGATVNVAGLMASSLGLYGNSSGSDAEFTQNTLYTQASQFIPALGTNPATATVVPGSIVVQPGATITAADQGNILLAGQNVTNGGSLSAPDGQVALAAGQTVYLAESGDPSLRGLIVEVTGGGTAGGGTVTNQAGGVISAPRGNVSLIGLAVNQDGVVSATTAVSANGSVILQAAQLAAPLAPNVCQPGETLCATQGGTLSIGPDSQIDIQPDASGGTAVVAQPQTQSSIQLSGEQVDIAGGQIVAPGGTLNVTAAADPDTASTAIVSDSAAQIRVAAGTSINLAGSDASLPMSANLLSIQLLDNELEDDPMQRTGALHGQTVIVDLRDGQPSIISDASWDSALEGIEENIYQRTAAGGSASFNSEGDILVSSGATINVSGGEWDYASGVTQTSQLIAANGQTYAISTASPSLTYTGVLNPTYTQTYNGFGVQISAPTPGLGQYQSGYAEGFSAGSVTFAAPTMALQGTLLGSVVNGPYQRSAASIPGTSLAALVATIDGNPSAINSSDPFPANGAAAIATGGTLNIGNPSVDAGSSAPEFFAPAVSFVQNAAPIVAADGTPLLPQPLQLPVSYLSDGGFASTNIYSDSTVTLPAGLPLNLGAGGSLLVVAPHVAIDSSIQALGGTIDLQTAQTAESQGSGQALGIDIGDGVTLNVSGQWTNNSIDAPASAIAPAYQNGGTIDLSLTSAYSDLTFGGALVLGNDVSLLASGGAWVQATNSVVGGAGGSIALDASPYQSTLQVGNGVTLQAFGVQGALGGAFTLNAPSITVVNGNGVFAQPNDAQPGSGATVDVGASLFSQDGFSSVSLAATGPVAPGAADSDMLTVTAGTAIDAQAQSLQLDPGFFTRATGGTVQGFTQAQTLPEADWNPYTINLTVAPASTDPNTTVSGDLDIQAGASISADPGSSINLSGEGSVLIDGLLRAPGGSITAQVAAPYTFDSTSNVLYDPGYLPNQRLELGSQGVLDVSGTMVPTLNTLNLPLGTVLSGGSVSLIADRGEIITDAGSSIDIAGASAPLDEQVIGGAGGYRLATIGSAGGSLLVQSIESVSLLGNLSAAAGASSSGTLEAGSLEVDLSGSIPGYLPTTSTGTPFPSAPYTIELVPSTANSAPSTSADNLAVLGITQLEQSGIDELLLQADDTIALDFSGSTPLTLGREISLDAPSIAVGAGDQAALNAPYVAFTDTQQLSSAVPAVAGTGSLTVTAQQIALTSFTTLQGVQTATLQSSGDVELEPLNLNYLAGGLTLAGNLTIDAARVYPATNAAYTISTANGTVTIGQTSASPGTPLSANGSLTIDAADIVSSGTLLAPFGQITLDATDSLSLLSGSLTSVSAAGLVVPYGQTAYGQEEWVYAAGNAQIGVTGIPNRVVSLSAPTVSVAGGATVDVSGGGDLSAYEWVPGTGGSVDSLSQSNAAAAGYYAVLPSTLGQYAAYDLQEFTGSAVTAGESVYLSSVAGLPAGIYPLLPARDALLPGAYLIQVQSGYQSLTPGTFGTLTTGAPVVAGYFTFGSTGLRSASGYTGFAVYPGSYGQSLAQYTLSDASSFFGAAAASAGQTQVDLPADAGTLMIDVGSALSVLGNVKAAAAAGGTGATVDIYTTGPADLTVSATAQAPGSGGVSIAAPDIAAWDAGDLILGGELSADGSSIMVTADTLTIGPGAQVSAGQVLAVADQGIDVQSGAMVASSSGLSGTALKTLPGDESLSLETSSGEPDGGAALLAVSDNSLPIAQRSGAVSGGATIDIESGATLSTRGAVALDAPAGVTVGGSIDAPGASWSLGSNSIAFVGSGSSGSSDTLQIGAALLSQMQTAGAIRLASAGAIDLLTPVMLGVSSASSAPSLSSLTLSASAINNYGGNSIFGAQTLSLEGTGPGSGAGGLPTATSGTGTLSLVAGTLEIGGAGSLAINGNTQTTLQAGTAVIGQGGTVAIGGNVAIAAPELTAMGDTSTTLSVQNTLQIQQNGTAASAASLTGSLGGAMALSANEIQDSGSIIVPGGTIALQAAADISLGSSAVVNAGGIDVTAMGTTVGAAGGIINIDAGGNLTLPAGAALSVAGAGDSPAGFLTLDGAGVVTLGATLDGSAAGDATGGSFSLQAGQLVDGLQGLAPNLASFTNQIDVRVGSGDLDLAAGTALTANQITLTADTGAIDIAGTLSAPSAGLRGSIGLFADDGVTLESGAQLLANGSASNANGGQIELSTVNDDITLDSGSVISASAQVQGQMGSLLLRAPALTTSADVAIDGNLAAGVSSGQITIEPVLAPIQSNADFTADFTPIQSEVSAYLSQVQAGGGLPASLQQVAGGPAVVLEPGVVVQAQGNLTLSQSLDLAESNLGAPIDLTVQASGNLNVNGSISGFTLSSDAGQPSSTLRFVAGADLGSANPLATVAGSGANLELGTGAIVQTGTGDIDLVASNDVVFDAGASAYTTGIPGNPAPVTIAKLGSTSTPVYFPTDGGNVRVQAGGDVVGTAVSGSVTDWQARTSQGDLGEWAVNLAAFDQAPWSVATFGGGDLSISAGGSVDNVSAAAADSMLVTGSTPTHFSSGGLTIDAAGSVTNGQFFVADGTGTLNIGGSLGVSASNGTAASVGTLFALEDSQISIWAQDDITINAVVNPTILAQPQARSSLASEAFFTYGADSALNAQSTSGSVTLSDEVAGDIDPLVGATYEAPATALDNAFVFFPASLKLVSLTQDLQLSDAVATLFPSSSGQLQLFAGRDIVGGSLYMSDAASVNFATAASVTTALTNQIDALTGELSSYNFFSDLHVNDPTPASIVAGGDIDDLTLSIPKASDIEAGGNIVDLNYLGQNLDTDDVTLIYADGSFTDAPTFSALTGGVSSPDAGVQVGGPGSLDILAGGNIDLGFSQGVTTVGNLVNGNLGTASGADITMAAGLGQAPAYTNFYQQIIEPSTTYQQQLVSYVESVTGQSDLSVAQAEAAFTALNVNQQSPFIDNVFFNELNQSGLEANATPSAGYSRGYAAIEALFPGSPTGSSSAAGSPYSGDLDLTYSQIESLAGGGISLLVPGGAINVGLANPPASGSASVKSPAQLGIVALGAGNVDIYALSDVNVNTSRVFTLGGGNILIWSQQGSIDAGNGAKTSLSIPPPTVVPDPTTGQETLSYNTAVAGSGIRTIQTSPTEPAGNVDLIAPEGSVNAGDAGIGAAGNINIAAVTVTGVSNISFGGTATGVPALVSNISASLSGASATASSATTSASASLQAGAANNQQTAPLAQAAINWLDVFVTGLGEANCKPDDAQCLEREQQH